MSCENLSSRFASLSKRLGVAATAFVAAVLFVAAPALGPAEVGSRNDVLRDLNAVGTEAASPQRVSVPGNGVDAWVTMPAGGKPAYIGIHGGTVPVSLLTARGGSAMVALVGETGSDFLRMLRGDARNGSSATQDTSLLAQAPAPAVAAAPASGPDSATPSSIEKQPTLPDAGANATVLLAAMGDNNMPVIYASGRNFEQLDLIPADWKPFGLEAAPQVDKELPKIAKPKKNAKKSGKAMAQAPRKKNLKAKPPKTAPPAPVSLQLLPGFAA